MPSVPGTNRCSSIADGWYPAVEAGASGHIGMTAPPRAYIGMRSIGVAVNTGSGWQEPVADLNQSLPEDMQGYNDFPTLQADPSGRIWVFFRHRALRIRDGGIVLLRLMNQRLILLGRLIALRLLLIVNRARDVAALNQLFITAQIPFG